MAHSVEDVMLKLRELGDKQDALAAKHKAEMEPLTTAINGIESWLQKQLLEVGTDSFSVAGVGKFTTKTVEAVRCKAEDWQQLLEWCQETGRFDLIKKDISSTVAKQVLEETGKLPPACQLTVIKKPSFTRDRKAPKSKEQSTNE